jgi:hypothetical protein
VVPRGKPGKEIRFRVDESLRESLDETALELDRARNWLIEDILKKWDEQKKRESRK